MVELLPPANGLAFIRLVIAMVLGQGSRRSQRLAGGAEVMMRGRADDEGRRPIAAVRAKSHRASRCDASENLAEMLVSFESAPTKFD